MVVVGFVAKFAGGDGVSSNGVRKEDDPFLGVGVFFNGDGLSANVKRNELVSFALVFGGVTLFGVPNLLRVVRFTTPFSAVVFAFIEAVPFDFDVD